jgi:membrane protease subunit HflK
LQIDQVLTFGKKQLEFDLHKALVARLEEFNTGLRLSALEIREITPPDKVQQFFDKVINAEVEKKKKLNEAQGYYNRVVPAARSEADRIVQEARAYKSEKILDAEGEMSRFLARYEAYTENPKAHREKIYLEFISNIYPTLGEIRVVDSDNHPSSQLLVPISR